MTFVLSQSNYGKSAIRLVKVVRDEGRHELSDVTVEVMLDGDFRAAHDEGDNSALIATDTMRNAVYVLAAKHDVAELETFGRALVEHFVAVGPTVQRAQVRLVAHPWARLGEHEHAFHRGAGGERIAVVSGDGHSSRIEAGVEGLEVLRTTGSGWSGFVRDELTTLPETDDRILATAVSAHWSYAEGGIDYGASWQAARDAILEAFGDHYSPSVQFTLRRMGRAVLKAVDAIDRVHLSLPNRHHLLYDLSRFGLENANEVFQATTEPYGLIEGTVERAHL
jgi:urate oxidase